MQLFGSGKRSSGPKLALDRTALLKLGSGADSEWNLAGLLGDPSACKVVGRFARAQLPTGELLNSSSWEAGNRVSC